VQDAVEVDDVEAGIGESRQILGAAHGGLQVGACLLARDLDPQGQGIDGDDVPFRAHQIGHVGGQAPGSGADVEHALAAPDAERFDQDFAVVELAIALLVVGAGQRG
jgi:hypothetical protein